MREHRNLSFVECARLCICFWFALAAFSASSLTITATGDIDNDYESLSITIDVARLKVGQDIPSADLDATALVGGYIDVILPGDDSVRAISRGGPSSTETDGVNSDFYWEVISASIENDSSSTSQISYQLRVLQSPNSSTSLNDIKVDETESIEVSVRFNPSADGATFSGSTEGATFAFTIERLNAKPDEAPEGFGVVGIFHAIKANWTVKDSVVYTPSTVTRKPSQMVIYAFHESTASLALAAKVFNADGDDIDTTCTFVGGTNCISCAEDNVYLTSTQTIAADGLAGVRVTSNTGSASISELDPETTYTVVAQYSEGVKRTSCIQVKPSDNITLTELHGDVSTTGDPRCFVATAAYGSPFADRLSDFRWFRTVVRQYVWGRQLVNFYYAHSRPLADWIASSESKRAFARGILWLPAVFLGLAHSAIDNVSLTILVLMTLCSLLILSYLFFRLALAPSSKT